MTGYKVGAALHYHSPPRDGILLALKPLSSRMNPQAMEISNAARSSAVTLRGRRGPIRTQFHMAIVIGERRSRHISVVGGVEKHAGIGFTSDEASRAFVQTRRANG
jgi:hypothetical protein